MTIRRATPCLLKMRKWEGGKERKKGEMDHLHFVGIGRNSKCGGFEWVGCGVTKGIERTFLEILENLQSRGLEGERRGEGKGVWITWLVVLDGFDSRLKSNVNRRLFSFFVKKYCLLQFDKHSLFLIVYHSLYAVAVFVTITK